MSARRSTATKGLRAALAKKQVRTTHFDIPIVDSDTVDAVARRLQEARQAATVARYQDPKKLPELEREVEKLKAELDACFHRLTFRGLPGDDDLDRLMNQHPYTGDLTGDERPPYDMDGFNVALLVACCKNGDGMTEDDWREELWSERWTPQDRLNQSGTGIFNKVLEANQRDFSAGIPNG